MEKRKLTKEDIEKVRNIEGFPIGTDEDIIALSDAPYYTACPNPFIEEFIKENGTPYDEETDDYHREPFAADVSEGKHDPLYMAHSYHTKVPYRAIMNYILNYTNPGDIVLDGFSGSGMTGVAAQMCGSESAQYIIETKQAKTKLGTRKAILNDLSPVASFISYNFNSPFDVLDFSNKASLIVSNLRKECGWVYETDKENGLFGGTIDYTVWSDLFICPNCGEEICYWDISVNPDNSLVNKPKCPKCGIEINKNECERVTQLSYDTVLAETLKSAKQVPVKIFYSVNGKRFSKKPDTSDLRLLAQIDEMDISSWYPTNKLPEGFNTEQPKRSHGFYHVHQFYTKRNLYVLSKCYEMIMKEQNPRLRKILMFWFSSIYSRSHKCNRYMPNHNRHVGPLSGTLYIPYFQAEINIINLLEEKLKAIDSIVGTKDNKTIVSNQSTTDLRNIPINSIDYIFTDPPFGDNLNYSELNFLWESWLNIQTNNKQEAVINDVQGKSLLSYQQLMFECFSQYYRVLKPNRWMTVEFHNSKNSVWNAIQEAIQKSGFVIADVRTLDKQKGTTKQLSNSLSVQQDLVISAYKPKNSFKKKMLDSAGSEETAWEYVRQYLNNPEFPVALSSYIYH
ncbi:MAG: hypothetical protein IJI66_03015 [Erysipelotrichaceae bacterium]|nr:hypothetical protein [Erysipelotrichaceae bacterium]